MNIDETKGDISPGLDRAMHEQQVAAWDIETDGLDFRVDRIRTCQVLVPDYGIEVVQVGPEPPERLIRALASERVTKLFHHAPFDLRFMRREWGARARNVACTKVASKIVFPERRDHSLAALVHDLLGVDLDKSQRLSDWAARELSSAQVEYAAGDVEHLLALMSVLWREALKMGVGELLEQSFFYIPSRVETDLRGVGDAFAY